MSTRQRGNRAFESGRYNEALDHYERAIDAGDHSSEIYVQAAKAALRIGDFTLAERYYSQALRYGGDESVARELAEFYIATSNYTKAVRVLQKLLETTDRPQTVFNNLGAALMYAGAPLNAESYLMVAQQMNPKDPVPYVNLGVLYEKHLHNPRLAYGFYKCFLKLSSDSRQRGKVQARVAALEVRYRNDFPQRYAVACGTAYQPPKALSKNEMKDEIARRLAEESGGNSAEPVATETPDPAAAENESAAGSLQPNGTPAGELPADGDDQPIIIDRMVEAAPSAGSVADNSGRLAPHRTLTLAETAFAHHNHAQVVRLIEELPATELNAHAMGLYGRSLVALGNYGEAQRWLAAAVADEPNPADVAALLTVYQERNEKVQAQKLCQRFQEDAQYRELLRACAAIQKTGAAEPASSDK